MNITPDSGTVFEAGSTAYPSIAWLDSTHVVIAYSDAGDSDKGKVVCCSTAGVTPTVGAIVEFDAGVVSDIHIARLDDTHFVLAYVEDSDGMCRAGSISGTTITLGGVRTFDSSDTSYIALCGMDATHFVVASQDGDAGAGVVFGGSVSGVTITMGAQDIFASTYSAIHKSICSLSSTHFVIAYRQVNFPNNAIAVCGTLSGNTVTIVDDDGATFDTLGMENPSIAALDSTHFVIVYKEQYLSDIGKVIAGSVSGTTVTIVEDGATTFETGAIYFSPSITAVTDASFVIAFVDVTDSYKGKVIAGDVAGTTISIIEDDGFTFETGACGQLSVDSLMDGLYYAIAFVDTGDSSKGKIIIGLTTEVPTVTTQAVDTIVPGGATLNGNITDDGDASITEHGFVWKSGSDPVDIAGADGHSNLGAGAEGAFDQAKTGLAEATLFYVRAYATNSGGDGYGAAVSFTTGQTHSAVVALVPATGVSIEGSLVSAGVAAIASAAGVAIEGLLISAGAVAISPAAGVASIAHRVAGGAVTVTPDLGLAIAGYRVASAEAAISAGVEAEANSANYLFATVALAAAVGVEAEANSIRSGQVALTPDATAAIIANYITRGAVALTPDATIETVGNYITLAATALAVEATVSGAPTRVRFGVAGISIAVSVSAVAMKGIFVLLGLSGDLAPGSVLEIDSEHMTFTVDGVNALDDMVGNMFDIPPGDSYIEYDDDEGARTVAVDVTYTPRDA